MIDKFLQWFDETKLWHWLAKRIISHFTLRISGYTKFDFELLPELESILDKVRTDYDHLYTFVLCDRMGLGSKLIRWISKSQWSHAGIIINKTVIHMKASGMVIQGLPSLLKECDDFAIYKFKISDPVLVESRISRYKKDQAKVRYDFEQELSEDASASERLDLYCSELIYMVLKDIFPLKLSEVAGRRVFSPDDVAKQGELVWSFISK